MGFRAPDERTVEVTLVRPTPFLIKVMANHYAWHPLPIKVVLRYGALDEKSTQWTRPGNFVGSGPFQLNLGVPK